MILFSSLFPESDFCLCLAHSSPPKKMEVIYLEKITTFLNEVK